MSQFNESKLFLKKSLEDIALMNKIVNDSEISDSIFGFHAQQAVEKLLKSILSFKKVEFPKSHDLLFLFELTIGCNLNINLEIEHLCELLTP